MNSEAEVQALDALEIALRAALAALQVPPTVRSAASLGRVLAAG